MDTYKLNNSVVGRDFLTREERPSIDAFLDYRNFIKSEIDGYRKFPNQWYVNELNAIDEILKVLNEEENGRREESE